MLLLLWTAALAHADSGADPVDGGELSGSAYTLEEGTTYIGLNTELAHGFKPGLQAGTRVLDWRNGPSAWLEWSFRDTGSSAWALITYARMEAHGAYSYSLGARHTWGKRDGSRLSVGLRLAEGLDEYTGSWYGAAVTRRQRNTGLVLPLTADLVMGRHTLQLQGQVAPWWSSWSDTWLDESVEFEDVAWQAGLHWAVGWRVFRLSAGVTASNQVDAAYADFLALFGLPEPPVEVAPRLRLWWAF